MDTENFVPYLDTLASGYQKSQILFTALRAGVFDQLEEPRTSNEVAGAVGWSPRGTRMLLDGLVALNLVDKDGEAYRNAPVASQCLVEGATLDQTHIMRHRDHGYATWGQLEQTVQQGHGLPKAEESRSPEELRAFICGMNDIAKQSARDMLGIVDLTDRRNLLDIGAGPGTYSIACMEAIPELRATLFDLPEVIPIGREQVEATGFTDRASFVEGDLTTDELGSGFDLILVSNIIHSYGPDTNADLVKRCYSALKPGGKLIIKDFLLESDRMGPPFSLIFALHMLVHTDAGDTYSRDEVARWTDSAGFAPGAFRELTPQSGLWIVEKK